MKKFYISTFLASILLTTSCAADAPAPETNPCNSVSVSFAAGQSFSYTGSDGTTVSGVAPEGGITINDCVLQ